MNTKVILGLVGVAAAAGVGYYFYSQKKNSISLPSSGGQQQNNLPATGLPTALQQPAANPCQYAEGQLLRAKDRVFYVDGGCIRHYVSGGVYSKYKFQGKDIKQISDAEMNAITTGSDLQGIRGLFV